MSEEACFDKDPQGFLLTVVIHKARNLISLNADTQIAIDFNDEKKKTKVYQNSDCPFFNEYFTFELQISLEDLLKKNLRISVIQTAFFLKKNSIIGEVNISLSSVWKQQSHAFSKKWAVLEKIGEDNKNATAGYLQIDLSIISSTGAPAPVILQTSDDDVIEDNLLDSTTTDPATVKYLVNIYDGTFVVRRDYILQVTIGSKHTRTHQIKNAKHCKWNEQLIFHGKSQSSIQMFCFELLVQDGYQWKVKCSFELNFSDICWKRINGDYNKPSLGPAYIYLYEGDHKNLFYGKLMVSIETKEIGEKLKSSPFDKRDIPMSLNDSDYWEETSFTIKLVLINADALCLQKDHMGVYLNCESNFSTTVDLKANEYQGNLNAKFLHFDSNVRPVLTVNVKLPDNRLKFQMTNLIQRLIDEMDSNIKNFKLFEARYHDNDEYQTKCIKMFCSDLKDMLEGIKSKLFYKSTKKLTEFDENYLSFLRSTVEDCVSDIKDSIKQTLTGYTDIRNSLAGAMNDINFSTPDIFLNVTCDGKLLAYHRFNMKNYFHSQSFDVLGRSCGKIETILIKPMSCTHSCSNCGCFFGKFETLMWVGGNKEVDEWLPKNVVELGSNKIEFVKEKFFKYNVYVHQARIQPGCEQNGLCDPTLVIAVDGMQAKTKVVAQSLSPVWNEVLVIENIRVYDIDLPIDFPSIMMLLFDDDKQKMTLIGVRLMKAPLKPEAEKKKTILEKLPLCAPCIGGSAIESKPEPQSIHIIFKQFLNQFPPNLSWKSFHYNGLTTAEALMSAEVVHLSIPTLNLKPKERHEPIPKEIEPEMGKFRIEVTFAGIRSMAKVSRCSSGRYKVELTMGEQKLVSGFTSKVTTKNLDFLDPYASGYLMLPELLQYWPPIVIKHLDCAHKNCIVLGAAMIRRTETFFFDEKPKEMQRFLLNKNGAEDVEAQKPIDEFKLEENEPLLGTKSHSKVVSLRRNLAKLKMPELPKFLQFSHGKHSSPLTLESEYTWWIKFYNSNRIFELQNDCLHQLTIYNNELEKQEGFEGFTDWASPVDLIRAKSDARKPEKYATLKCAIKIMKCAGKEHFESKMKEKYSMSSSKLACSLLLEQPVVIRVYVVRALNLRSRDVYGYSDAFIKVEFGSKEISDRSHYIPNQFSPVFGRRFQLAGVVPRETLLKVSVYDRDTLSPSDLIGSTAIDIEDRIRTKYRANCGLPKEYNESGYNAWRHSQLPSEVLKNLCNELELFQPKYFGDHVELASINFKDTSDITKDPDTKERMALSVLNNFSKVPGIGFKLTPEHVETRSLYHTDQPGNEQGKLLMWVEIFDQKKNIPEPVDITPIPPQKFELRIIVWNTKDVIFDEKNVFGRQMSDIYVKGWLHDNNEAQFTDVHYRSLNGEGNFNWRMVFPLRYAIGEDMIVLTKRKKPFEKFDTEVKLPAVLNLQIWDNDKFSSDDFLGALSINLTHFPKPFATAADCSTKRTEHFYENIFACNKSVRGWFPMCGKATENGATEQTGKIELELEVLLDSKARLNVVGLGREGPNKLPPPNRPDTSFNWISNPVQSIKQILWPVARKYVIFILIAMFVALVVALVIAIYPHSIHWQLDRSQSRSHMKDAEEQY